MLHPNALAPGFVSFLGIVAVNGFLDFAPLSARDIDLANVGLVFTVASLTIVVVRLLLGWVPDVIGPIRAGSGALLLTAAGALVVALWAEPAGLFVGAVMLAGGLSLQSPSLIAIAVEGISPNERGSAMATFTGFFDIANAIVGPTIGLIVAGTGYRAAFVTAAIVALAGLVFLRVVVAPRWNRARSLAPAATAV